MTLVAIVLFVVFIGLMLLGVPIGVSLGLGGLVAIGLSNLDTQMFGLLAVPQNFYAGLAKYPLLAIPMFVLVGSIFDRSAWRRGWSPSRLPWSGVARACCRWWRFSWRCSSAASRALARPTRRP